MTLELTGAVIMLGAVLLAGPVVLVADHRQRKLRQQIALIASLGRQDTGLAQVRSIRREKMRFPLLREIGRNVLCYNMELPDAYSIPVPFVLAAGLLAGVVACLFTSLTLPLPVSVVVGCAVGGFSVRGIFRWQRNRYVGNLLRQLPDTLQFVVSAVRAGFPVMEAFRGITREVREPTRGQFVGVCNEIALGRPIHDALLSVYHRTRVTEYAIFAVTLAVQSKTGGHLAETIQTLAETIRERITIAARAKALAGEGTVSATILSILPVITGIALTVIRPDYLEPLIYDQRGKRLLLMAVGFLLAGIWMMRRMIEGAQKE